MTASGVQALVVLLCGAACAGLAAFVWSRRQGATGASLALLLLALCAWNLAYGGELLAHDAGTREAWGDLKYLGICALTPAWPCFVLLYTGRVRRVSPRLLLALSVEPVVLLVLLAVRGTHDLVRHLPEDPTQPVVGGPLFWLHLAWTDAILLPATGLLVVSLVRRSRAYWLQAAALVAATLLPWVVNLLFNLQVGVFGRMDLTPVAFTASGAVLAWGLFRQRLLRLRPLARSLLVERMTDLVLVLDAYGHVVDANPAAEHALEPGAGPLLGRLAREVLPEGLHVPGDRAAREVVLGQGDHARTYEVADVALPGRSGAGGRLLVLRDVTARSRLEAQLRDLLAEQARVAQQLSSSLRPSELPDVPGLALAARFRPAGSGQEIGGDFYDVFPIGGAWAFTLGDVSGKGARAAAVTASARYALRTLALAGHAPAEALRQLNRQVAREHQEDETYLTVAHGWVRPDSHGARVGIALGGHPQPYVVRAGGAVEAVGVPGTAIGLLPDVDVTDAEVLLQPGDGLVLFTDGISEARGGPGLFGEGGLERSLARRAGQCADELAQGLLDEVLALQDQQASDDIALLVLQAAPVPAAPPAPRLPADGRQRA